MIGLERFRNDYPAQLSGGMAQRVALVRTLINEPEILLLDEPLGALDEFTRMNMQDEILNIWSQRKQLALMVTHSIDEALILADRIVLLSGGRAARSYDLPAQDGCRDILTEPFLSIKKSVMEAMKSL